jgi:AraC-like DNA-binding protein
MITVQGKYDQPLLVQLKGILNKITIIFKPLGLNAFIRKPFIEVANQPTQLFSEWNNEKGYSLFLDTFFNAPDNREQIQISESFLLSIYNPTKECELLEKGIDLLCDFDKHLSVKDVSNNLGMNERTFNRLFEKLVGISPVGFRKIARFRHSLMNKIFTDKFKRLTEIGYASNFCDQSYFIKVYNKLAGTHPKNFFDSIDKLADDNLIFRFINNKV